jgi:hypothetical protein
MTLIFTRYLYNADEVVLTLIECLLKQQNLDECYYWIYEYYKSGYQEQTWKLMYKIYYDFYMLKNPKFEEKINEKYTKWRETNDIKFVLWIIKNLFRFDRCYTIFLLRVYHSNRNTEVLGKTITNCIYKDKNEIMLATAIKEKKKISMSYYLKRVKDERKAFVINSCFDTKIQLNDNYNDNYHYLLAKLINKFKITPKKKVYYKMVMKKEIENVLESDKSCKNEGKHEDISYVYKTLAKNRIYGISPNIGCFKLEREGKDLNHCFWYHWEYYAYKSPIWKERFNKYKIKVSDKKQLVEFDDEDELEKFYEEYGYEPDEQSAEIQQKSSIEIKRSNLKLWLNGIFKKKLTKSIRVKIAY